MAACGGGDGKKAWVGTKLIPSDGVAKDHFGYAMALSTDGNTVVVGAPYADTGRGGVYVLAWDGARWSETKLIASDAAYYDEFGSSVAVSADGSTVLAGTHKNEAAYVFEWDGIAWNETKLADPGAGTVGASQGFGSSVALSQDASVVVVASSLGSTYVFERDLAGWAMKATLNSSKVASSTAISSDNDTIVQGWADSSTVAVYRRDGASWSGTGWTETLLQPSDAVANDEFGRSVSTSFGGDTIHVGAPTTIGFQQGAAYVYRRNGASWGEEKLVASDGRLRDFFGCSVSAAEDGTFVVGATGDAGTGYVYRPDGSRWTEAKLTPTDGATAVSFGASAAISSDGSTVAIGAPDYSWHVGGSVYVFRWRQ